MTKNIPHTPAMTNEVLALGSLSLHPANVRAKDADAYTEDNTAHLRASIAAQGMIQPLVVQKIGKNYGVLAGGRRLFSLQTLAKETKVKGVNSKTGIDCRVIPEDCDATTAISLAENITQEAMSPIDEYEAFARMMEIDGQDVETIAMTFGTTETAVKNRLRYGLVHEDIRAAVRRKELTLEAMKAFADHPSQDVQFEVYEALIAEGARPAAHQIRAALKSRGVQVSDVLGVFVRDAYEARGGAVARDLIDEHSVLEDMGLIEEVLRDKLMAVAEEARAAHGFAWADVKTEHDWNMFAEYGRVYPEAIEPDENAAARLEALAEEMTAIETALNADTVPDDEYDALSDRFDALEREVDTLSEAYTPEDLSRAGVFAVWQRGGVQITLGLVRPEDIAPAPGDGSSEAGSSTTGSDGAEAAVEALSASLKDDLRSERATALGAALMQVPDLAQDLALFKLATDVLGGMTATYAVDLRANRKYRSHAKQDEIDTTATDTLKDAEAALDLSWHDQNRPVDQQFATFRALPASSKAQIVAYALAMTVEPCSARHPVSDTLMYAVEQEIMPDVRAFWAPNAAFFSRLKKAALLDILSSELGLVQEALNLANSSKREVVEFLDQLFAEPFATLSDAQREAVARWAPRIMATSLPEQEIDAELEQDDPAHVKAAA